MRLETQFTEAGMVVGSASRRPVEEALAVRNGDIIDAGLPEGHQTVGIELPELVAVRPKPLSR